jgi:hypothetical protein
MNKEERLAGQAEDRSIVDQTQSSRLRPDRIRAAADPRTETVTPATEEEERALSDGSDVPTARNTGPRPRPRSGAATTEGTPPATTEGSTGD